MSYCLNLYSERKDVDTILKTMLKKRKEMRPCEEVSTEEHHSSLCDLFLRGGISEKEFKEILPTIDKKNRETVI